MTTLKILAAAAVATSLTAVPVMAKDSAQHSDAKKTVKTHKMKKADKQARLQMRQRDANMAYERGYSNGYERRAAVDTDYDRYDRTASTTYYGRDYDTGFWPADVAAGVVGGAVSTAGAIASAPFRDTYASYDNTYQSAPVYRSNVTSGWNDNWNNDWNNNWARRQSVEQGGFACTPGSYYTNSFGYTQLCQ